MSLGILLFTVFLTGCLAFPPAESTPPESSTHPPLQSESSAAQTPDPDDPPVNEQRQALDSAAILEEQENYTVYELTFQRDSLQIYGNLYLPNTDDQQYPTAIIAHGFGSSHSYMAPYAAYLAEQGIAGYVFDFCGGSTGSRSNGSTLDMSVLTEVSDMQAVLDGITDYSFVDLEQVYLMGESQGGLVSALLAERSDEDVHGLIMLYPALVIPDDARERYASASDIPEMARVFGTPVGRTYFSDVLDMDVFQEIGNFSGPVLIVHGDADSIAPISYSQQAVELYPAAELVTLDGAGHGFYGSFQLEAESQIAAFLKRSSSNQIG